MEAKVVITPLTMNSSKTCRVGVVIKVFSRYIQKLNYPVHNWSRYWYESKHFVDIKPYSVS